MVVPVFTAGGKTSLNKTIACTLSESKNDAV